MIYLFAHFCVNISTYYIYSIILILSKALINFRKEYVGATSGSPTALQIIQ